MTTSTLDKFDSHTAMPIHYPVEALRQQHLTECSHSRSCTKALTAYSPQIRPQTNQDVSTLFFPIFASAILKHNLLLISLYFRILVTLKVDLTTQRSTLVTNNLIVQPKAKDVDFEVSTNEHDPAHESVSLGKGGVRGCSSPDDYSIATSQLISSIRLILKLTSWLVRLREHR